MPVISQGSKALCEQVAQSKQLWGELGTFSALDSFSEDQRAGSCMGVSGSEAAFVQSPGAGESDRAGGVHLLMWQGGSTTIWWEVQGAG